jgi:hypothetical protein
MVRGWTHDLTTKVALPTDPINQVTAPVGQIDCYVTVNAQGKATFSFNVTGSPKINGLYVLNNQGQWVNFVNNGNTGASLTKNADGSTTVTVNFQDGGRGDADNSKNGVVHVEFALTDAPLQPVYGSPLGGNLTGDGKPNQFIVQGGHTTLKGSQGFANEYYYTSPLNTGSTITNFQPGTDRINLTEVLNSIGYKGTDPINAHYIGFKQIATGIAKQGTVRT